jgi:hypothetical protein
VRTATITQKIIDSILKDGELMCSHFKTVADGRSHRVEVELHE